MKRISIILVVLLLICTVSLPSFAQNYGRYVIDKAGILLDQEGTSLQSMISEINGRQEVELVALIADTTSGKSLESFADDYCDQNGYGENCGVALLLIADAEGDVWISTYGEMIDVLTDDEIESTLDAMMDDLRIGDYASAIRTYAQRCDELITDYREGEQFHVGTNVAISLAIGFVISLIVVTIMKGKLKSVRAQDSASDYVKKDSMKVNESRDTFMYHTVSRIARQTDSGNGGSSTHISSSGRTHGGGGRSFR